LRTQFEGDLVAARVVRRQRGGAALARATLRYLRLEDVRNGGAMPRREAGRSSKSTARTSIR
jgi:hypothetical protein